MPAQIERKDVDYYYHLGCICVSALLLKTPEDNKNEDNATIHNKNHSLFILQTFCSISKIWYNNHTIYTNCYYCFLESNCTLHAWFTDDLSVLYTYNNVQYEYTAFIYIITNLKGKTDILAIVLDVLSAKWMCSIRAEKWFL